MQYPGSGPGWRMQRPPRVQGPGGDFGPRFGPSHGGFGPPRGGFGPPRGGFGPPPWAFRGRGGRARGGPPVRVRGPPPPHMFMAQQEVRGPSPQEVLSTEPAIRHNREASEATQGDPQVRRRTIRRARARSSADSTDKISEVSYDIQSLPGFAWR